MDVKIIWPRTRKHVKEYLVGLIIGDGQIEQKRITITDSSDEFLKNVAKIVRKYLGVNVTLHKRGDVNAYYMRIYGKDFVENMKRLIPALKGRPTINFIRGFFDAEGTIYREGKYIVIEINQHDGPIIANLSIALRDRCIYSYIRYQEYLDKRRGKIYTRYILRIKRKTSAYRFLTKVGLRHPKHLKVLGLHPL